MQKALLILIVAICATLLSCQAAKDAALKGSKTSGVFLAAFVAFAAWALLSQGLNDEWPAAVGWVVFLAGAFEAITTSKE